MRTRTFFLIVFLLSVAARVSACPGCKEPVNGAFNWSIYFLLGCILSMIAAACFFVYRVVKRELKKTAQDAESVHTSQGYWTKVTLPLCLGMVAILMIIPSLENESKATNSRAAYLTEEAVRAEILKTGLDTLVVFKSDRCTVCAQMKPVLDEVAAGTDPKVNLVYADAMKSRVLASEYNVDDLPCSVLFRGGKEIGRRAGLTPASGYTGWLKESAK